jgi:hypothetical protein
LIFFGLFIIGLFITLTSLAVFRSSEHIIVYVYYKDNNEIHAIG